MLNLAFPESGLAGQRTTVVEFRQSYLNYPYGEASRRGAQRGGRFGHE